MIKIVKFILLTIYIMLIILFLIAIGTPKNSYDVNNDGKVNSKDMLDLRKYLIEKGE